MKINSKEIESEKLYNNAKFPPEKELKKRDVISIVNDLKNVYRFLINRIDNGLKKLQDSIPPSANSAYTRTTDYSPVVGGGQKTFTTAKKLAPDSEFVFVNTTFQVKGVDYTITNNDVFKFVNAPEDSLVIKGVWLN